MFRRIGLVIVVLALLSGVALAQQREVKVYVDGKPVEFDVAPRIENGRTLVPLRFVSEALKATVTWDEPTWSVRVESGFPKMSALFKQNCQALSDIIGCHYYMVGIDSTTQALAAIANDLTAAAAAHVNPGAPDSYALGVECVRRAESMYNLTYPFWVGTQQNSAHQSLRILIDRLAWSTTLGASIIALDERATRCFGMAKVAIDAQTRAYQSRQPSDVRTALQSARDLNNEVLELKSTAKTLGETLRSEMSATTKRVTGD